MWLPATANFTRDTGPGARHRLNPERRGLAFRPGVLRGLLRAEGMIQGKQEQVTGLQGVRQDGLRGSGLSERRGDDQDVARARLVPGRDENASAGGLRAAGLEADDPVLAKQRVVVADQPASGTTAVGIAAIAASAGIRIAAMPRRTWSAAVLVVDGFRPEGSV